MQVFTKVWEIILNYISTYFNANVCLFFICAYFVTIVGRECLRPGHWVMDTLAPAVLCGNSLATCAQERHLWIWIYPWISTHKSVDMDMDGKFHIHGKPVNNARYHFFVCGPKFTTLPEKVW